MNEDTRKFLAEGDRRHRIATQFRDQQAQFMKYFDEAWGGLVREQPTASPESLIAKANDHAHAVMAFRDRHFKAALDVLAAIEEGRAFPTVKSVYDKEPQHDDAGSTTTG